MNNKNKEYERRFLILNDDWKKEIVGSSEIIQHYLSIYPSIRVRSTDNLNKVLTIKGLENDEFENPIKIHKYERLVLLSKSLNFFPINKTRNYINATLIDSKKKKSYWEVDVFKDDNEGLVVAEIELKNMDVKFEKPSWLGPEITHIVAYKNSALAKTPFKTWDKNFIEKIKSLL